MYSLSENEFLKLSAQGNLIPLYREILGDLDTPVSAYYKISQGSDYSFLLESVEGKEKVSRFSFLAAAPEMIIKSKDQIVEIMHLDNGRQRNEVRKVNGTPLSVLREILSQFRFVKIPGLPRFCGGMVGYIGYDMVRFFEKLPDKPKDDLALPDMVLVLAKTLVIFDHINHKIKVVHNVHLPDGLTKQQKLDRYRSAVDEINKVVAKIRKPLTMEGAQSPVRAEKLKVHSNFTKEHFQKIVREAQKDIRNGEIIQVVLSQRFQVDLKTDPLHIYRMLRALNPSPYMYHLRLKDIEIIGSSPELLVRCEDGIVETRPIAGTRPRGRNEEEDTALSKNLLEDPKERAEHLMLVDLGRNDLGRVCRKGSVHVPEFMTIEKYSHVMHIVSSVRGLLQKGKDSFDVLQAAFPAGTLSGAPKIRAMEIIDRLENVSRGPYGGCIGYFSFSGNLDSCITIRTIVVKNKKAYIQAGGGIVADSVPSKEFQESVNKAKAQILAIELAHAHFGMD